MKTDKFMLAERIGDRVVEALDYRGYKGVTYSLLEQLFDISLRFVIAYEGQRYGLVYTISQIQAHTLFRKRHPLHDDFVRFGLAMTGKPLLTDEQEFANSLDHHAVEALVDEVTRAFIHNVERWKVSNGD